MRQTISGLVAAIAVVTVSAGSAMACGGGLFTSSSCSPCGQAYVSPCAQGYSAGYGYAGVAAYERLPDPTYQHHHRHHAGGHQYFYANQGPTHTGPGQFAPYPTYQETAISGWRNYERGVDSGYDGGPYGNATNHYSDAQPYYRAPAIYSYRMQPRVHYGYAHRSHGPRMMHAPRYGMRHHGYPLRRMN